MLRSCASSAIMRRMVHGGGDGASSSSGRAVSFAHRTCTFASRRGAPKEVVASPSQRLRLNHTSTRRRFSTKGDSNSSSSGGKQFKNEAERIAYLRQANATMEEYHNARELMKKGKLPRHASHPSSQKTSFTDGSNAGAVQMAVVGAFLCAFLATPYIGKRIAQDEDFRRKYIPSWYNYTIKKPDSAWTREELHEQRLQVEQALRERAAAGDFSAEKLEQLEQAMEAEDDEEGVDAARTTTTTTADSSPEEQRQAVWDKWHPGLADDEKVNEDD